MKLRLVFLLTLAGLCVATPARAGVYTVRSCSGTVADPAWTSLAAPGSMSTAQCPATAGNVVHGLFAADAPSSGNAPQGSGASWTLTAPTGTTLSSLTVQRYLFRWFDWDAQVVAGDGTILETCDVPWTSTSCTRGSATGAGPQNSVTYSGLRTANVTFRVRCTLATGCSRSPDRHRAIVGVYAASATVEDAAPPVVAPLSGSFGDAGWHKGADTVTVSAADASGVKQLRIVAGGVELGRKDGACDYSRMQPCPSSLGGTFSFDTSKVPDGTHELQAIATDAAEQPGVAVGSLRVDRHAPATPKELTVTVAENGTYDVKWTNPEQGTASPIVAAHYALCDPSPALTCQPAQRVAKTDVDRLAGVVAPAGKGSLRVWLEDEAGNVDPGTSAVAPVDPSLRTNPRVLDTNPPILLPSGPAPSSRLKIAKARRTGATLTLSGTIARGASARVSAQLARTKGGKAIASARTSPRRGAWTIKVKVPRQLRSANAIYLTLSFAGEDNFRKTTLKRKLSRRASGNGSTAIEFSVESGR